MLSGKFEDAPNTDATLCVNTAKDYFTIFDYIGNSVVKISMDGNFIEQKYNNIN